MVRDYVQEYYEPAASATDVALADHAARARELAAWRARVVAAWPGVKVAGVESDGGPAVLGQERHVAVTVDLGSLGPTDVAVQVLHGPVGAADEIAQPDVLTLTHLGVDDAGRARWEGHFRCDEGRPLRLHRPRRARPPGPRHPRRARARHLGLTGPPPSS